MAKVAPFDVVEYDADTGTVAAGPAAEAIEPFLALAAADERDR